MLLPLSKLPQKSGFERNLRLVFIIDLNAANVQIATDQVRIAQGGDGGQPRLSVGERIVPLPLLEGLFQRMYNPASAFVSGD